MPGLPAAGFHYALTLAYGQNAVEVSPILPRYCLFLLMNQLFVCVVPGLALLCVCKRSWRWEKWQVQVKARPVVKPRNG